MNHLALLRATAVASLTAVVALTPVAVLAQDFNNQLRARQGQMRVHSANLGVLVAMARGDMDYDAETAQAAADNLVLMGQLDQRFVWPEGSSTLDIENTRALPEIWDDYDAFLAEWDKFAEATATLQGVASDGQEALGPGLQVVGGSCGSCHESFQQSD